MRWFWLGYNGYWSPKFNKFSARSNTIVDRYLYPDLEKEFGIALNALKARMRAANINPCREGRTPFVTREQADILRQQHQYLETPGTTLKSYQDAYGITDIAVSDTSEPEDLEVVFSSHDEFMRNARDEILMNQRLKAYASFETYHLLNKTISDRECEEIIGWKPPRTGFREESYRFVRISKTSTFNPETGKFESQKLWKIEKVNLERELLLKQDRRKQRKLAAAASAEEEEKAIANHVALKQALS
jgi:hypothetical protein